MGEEDQARTDVIRPADHGIFLGRFDPEVSRLVLTTFTHSTNLQDEEIFALGQLNRLREERLTLSALDLVANGWTAHEDTQVIERLIDI